MERRPLAGAPSRAGLSARRETERWFPGLRDRASAVSPSGYVSYAFALGDLVRSMAGHCSEMSGSGVSLPVMRSGTMA